MIYQLAFLFLLLTSGLANIYNIIQTNTTYSSFKNALGSCSCTTYTNQQGILLLEHGNFFVVANSGAANLGTITEDRLGLWFMSNITLNLPEVPVYLNTLQNDQVLPSRSGMNIRFNIYGNVYSANGVQIHNEHYISTSNQILWTTNDAVVGPLLVVNGWDYVQNENDLDILQSALAGATITGILTNPNNPVTLFAPTDQAFTQFGSLIYNRLDLFSNVNKKPVKDRLTRILNYHFLDNSFWKVGLTAGNFPTLLTGKNINISGSTITDEEGDTSTITTFDIGTTTTVIHKIDQVLLPEPIPTFSITLNDWNSWNQGGFPDYTDFIDYAKTTDFFDTYLDDPTETGYTFIAPARFTANENLLNYIVRGVYFTDQLTNDMVLETLGGSTLRFNRYESWYVNGRPLTDTFMDWVTVNGALHVYANPVNQAIPFFTGNTVWDRIPANHPFRASLQSDGLQSLLSGNGSFTVLLPTETAWNAITNPSSELIRAHIVTSTIFKDFPGIYPTLQGSPVNLSSNAFNGVPVQNYDVPNRGATNGMVVFLGGALPVPEPAQTTSQFAQQTTQMQFTTAQFETTGEVPIQTTASEIMTTGSSDASDASKILVSILLSFVAIFVSLL